ncbi:hypothetical protein NUW58_g9171 [Xylaria curta]|uniref:Uncharacterized protein n=1 Tax=Xylaria curta TaxID=42375 RepID=A0ACC1N0B8_9PEZI|nr:hypothetical protein NUW58_g9171 [Xylaria curta]
MTDPADNRPSTADHSPEAQHARTPPPFAPVFTLVNNTSTRTTHHPHVRYIFSDDDPDILTEALADVAWASSLSPSWAVLNAQLSQISPPSSDAGHSSGSGAGDPGVETNAPTSLSELRISDEASRQRPGSASGSGSGQRERDRPGEVDDFSTTLDEFEKRMAILRKVVDAGEDRRKKMAPQTTSQADVTAPNTAPKDTTTD